MNIYDLVSKLQNNALDEFERKQAEERTQREEIRRALTPNQFSLSQLNKLDEERELQAMSEMEKEADRISKEVAALAKAKAEEDAKKPETFPMPPMTD